MSLLQFIFARKNKDSSLLKILSKIDQTLAGQGFLIDEKRLPMPRSKLTDALNQEMNKATFCAASQNYRQRIARGYWTLTRFHRNVDMGLRSIFTAGSPNFMKIDLMVELNASEDALNARARQEREAAKSFLQGLGLWKLIPSEDQDIWPH